MYDQLEALEKIGSAFSHAMMTPLDQSRVIFWNNNQIKAVSKLSRVSKDFFGVQRLQLRLNMTIFTQLRLSSERVANMFFECFVCFFSGAKHSFVIFAA